MGSKLRIESLAESSELLRLSLPLMAKYTVPVTPTNYAVWYEYVAGQNSSLKEKIDGEIKKGGQIGDGFTQSLYKEYIDPSSDLERVQQSQKVLDSITDSVAQTIEEASGEVYQYSESLKICEKKFNESMPTEDIRSLFSDLTGLTDTMSKNNEEIIASLIQARNEADALRKELKKVKAEAKTDPLTQLANRKAFTDYITEMKSAPEIDREGHCILMADIDNFKIVNDTYGHLFGDKVLKIVSTILKRTTKGKDLPARYGGEEFIILLPFTNIQGAQTVAEHIRCNLEEGRIVKPKTGEEINRITISIGATPFSLDEPFDQAVARADGALYNAKAQGKNRVVVG